MKVQRALFIFAAIISTVSKAHEAAAQISSADLAFFARSDKEVLDQSIEAGEQRRAEQRKPRTEVPINLGLLNNYVGYYELLPGTIFEFTRSGSGLFFKSVQRLGEPVEILPESDHTFFIKYGATQFTFLPGGQEPAKELIFHAGGYDRRAIRISEAEALAYADSLEKRYENKIAVPGSDAVLRRAIEAEQQGSPLYDEMGPLVARDIHNILPFVQKKLSKLGAIQSLAFKAVGPAGADVYDVTFANGSAEWRIFLAPDGKIRGLSHRFLP